MENFVVKLNDVQLGYLAGMIDGEGCINYYKSNSKSSKIGYTFVARLYITNTNLEVLLYLRNLLGFGRVRLRTKQLGRKQSWNLDFGPRQTRVVLESVVPYLIIKKKQAELIIQFLRSCIWGRGKGNCLTRNEIDSRHHLFEMMKSLNMRGDLKITSQ